MAENAYCPMMVAQPWLALKYISYAWEMYSHRNTLMRKNSKRKKGYMHSKIHVANPSANEYDYSLVPLHTYYDNERKNHEWKGGHHASPVEHERRAYDRRIFNEDGTVKRTVSVRGTTVNKGNTKDKLVDIKLPKQ